MWSERHRCFLEAHFDQDERAIAEAVERFARAELAPSAGETDERGIFTGRHLPALASLGLTGMNLPERWGGAGLGPRALMLAVESVAAACGSTASMLTAHFLATDAVLLGGDDEQRERLLPAAAAGEALGAFALTEPGAGSDPADMSTRAVAEGEDYRLQGVKQFISNGAHAGLMVVFALTEPERGARGVSAFVVEPPCAGVSAGPPEPTMGLKGGHVFEVALDCRVPAANRLGAHGEGFRTAMRVLDRGRLEVAAMSIGIARAALDAAVAWARERHVGGRPVASRQGIRWMLADMATDLEAARLLALRAADLRARGERFGTEASMAKLHASEMAARVTDRALQVHGGYGYSREMPLERYARDARVMRIYEGSSEIQRNLIARAVLG